MFKPSILAVFMLSWASAAIASTQTVKLSPKAAHTLDFSSLGCTVEKAFFGDPAAVGYFDINLDQPQPQTQKITLRWKGKREVNDAFLQLHLKGCSQNYAQIEIKRADEVPASPVTYVNPPAPVASAPAQVQSHLTARQPKAPVGLTPVQKRVGTGQPLSLTQKSPSTPKPKVVKRPPARRMPLPQQPKTVLTAARLQPDLQITPNTLLKGLNVARSRGEIGYGSDMHYRVNGMIRSMRSGADPQAASQKAGVPESVVQALIGYSRR